MAGLTLPKYQSNQNQFNFGQGFTLVELLVVIAIVAIVATAIVLVINPLELTKRTRDTVRLSDLSNLRNAINLAMQEATGQKALSVLCVGSATYPCFGSSNTGTRISDGTGWVKVNLKIPGNFSLSVLPVDPINDANNHYMYCADNDNWEIGVKLESSQQSGKTKTDGGGNDDLYEVGSKLSLIGSETGDPIKPCTYSTSSTQYVGANGYLPNSSNIIGGWNIDSVDIVQKAAAAGVNTAFIRQEPPSSTSDLGKAMIQANMQVISNSVWKFIYKYECYKTWGSQTPPSDASPPCQTDFWTIPSLNALFNAVTTYLQQDSVKNNPLIKGYWVLDDWPGTDPGGARDILPAVRQAIHQYAPGKIVICGFGLNVYDKSDDPTKLYLYDNQWAVLNNFTPDGCDMLAFYFYPAAYTSTANKPTAFDWDMQLLLTTMMQKLTNLGWDKNRTPFIADLWAYSGEYNNALTGEPTGRFELQPTHDEVVTESHSFCQKGAIGVNYYAWNSSRFINPQGPMNNTDLYNGVKDGILACKAIW